MISERLQANAADFSCLNSIGTPAVLLQVVVRP